jgi:cholest-4-en-3-one 26-monooxygenase
MAVDLSDPASFRAGVPHDEFDRIRRDEPVHWTPTTQAPRGGFWSLTRFDDVAAASRDVETFTSTRGINYPTDPSSVPQMVDNVMFNDPPRHGDIRRLVGTAFSPRMVARFSDWISERVDLIVDGLAGRGECDLVPLVAVELPAQVICSVMGVADEDRGTVVEWADAIFSREQPGGFERFQRALGEVFAYAFELREVKRLKPDNDMVTELSRAEGNGLKITDSEYMQFFMSLLIAGFETTHTLIGQSIRLMLEDPEIARISAEAVSRGKTRELVEEYLRYITPAMHMARHATRDVVINDTTISEGDMVLLWYVAANRDPAVFSEPHQFNPARARNLHASFGAGGPHFCIGNHLARLEVRILFETLLTRGPIMKLNGQPRRGHTVFINALSELPVVCT